MATTTTAVADGTRVESEKSRAGPLREGKRRRGRNDSLKITSHFLDPPSIRASGRVYVAVGYGGKHPFLSNLKLEFIRTMSCHIRLDK